jgi:hypothetical protein
LRPLFAQSFRDDRSVAQELPRDFDQQQASRSKLALTNGRASSIPTPFRGKAAMTVIRRNSFVVGYCVVAMLVAACAYFLAITG